jgi:unsaturated rhamnogalacturonyl hydrolase
MATYTSAHDILRRAADRTMDYDFTVWFWGDSIAMDGLAEAAALLNYSEAQDFCLKYYRRWAKGTLGWADHMAPGYALLKLYQRTNEQSLCDAAIRLARFMLEDVPRTRDGAPLYRPDQPTYRHNIWVDTIYHVPPFYALLAQVTGESRYYDEALREWDSHVRWLSSNRGPFLAHAIETGNRVLRGYGWGRGNGWALYGMVDTLELIPAEHPGRIDTLNNFRQLSEAILALQDSSGFWRTLLHEREAYLESSTAAFFGAAFTKAVRLALLDERFSAAAERAWQATISRIDDDGGFTGVSACTWAGTLPDDLVSMYKALPTEVNVWGQGSALRFAAERIHAGL